MPAGDKKRSLYRALVDRVLDGNAHASADQRRRAFDNAGLPEPLLSLVDKVATRSSQVTDRDIVAVGTAGFSDDQIFELVICAAVGQAARQYESGLAALTAASERESR